MKINKNNTTNAILKLCQKLIRSCQKDELDNIVFPKWSDIGLLGMMFRQYLRTKEQPDGNLYDEAQFQTVLRVIKGKVLMSDRPDAYCWKFDKLQKAMDVRAVGANSAEGLLSLCNVLGEIRDEEEKKLVADMFASLNKDLLLVHTPAENRRCIEVTRELYDQGLTQCVDEWMKPDEAGMAEATELHVGDFLIVSENGVYCVRHEEFLETYTLL